MNGRYAELLTPQSIYVVEGRAVEVLQRYPDGSARVRIVHDFTVGPDEIETLGGYAQTVPYRHPESRRSAA